MFDQRLGAGATPGDDPLPSWSDPPALSEQLRQLDASAAHGVRSSQGFPDSPSGKRVFAEAIGGCLSGRFWRGTLPYRLRGV
jgi:hypothetical protein